MKAQAGSAMLPWLSRCTNTVALAGLLRGRLASWASRRASTKTSDLGAVCTVTALMLWHTVAAHGRVSTVALAYHCWSHVSQTMNRAGHVPVAIAGAGPTGLTLAALLSRLQIPCVVLERAPALPTHPQVSAGSLFLREGLSNCNDCTRTRMPRCIIMAHSTCAAPRLQCASEAIYSMQAHYINHRSMEVFRSMGGNLAAQVVRRSPPLDQWRSFVYCESVTGRLLGSVDHFPVSRFYYFLLRPIVSLAVSIGHCRPLQ